jgi:histidyl-tRNA synthetase
MPVKTQPARGMRDFLPADVRRREYVIGVIRDVYERYGFEPLETPAVENIETLTGKYGEEGNQLIFKILKRGEHEKTGEADLALRYDLTVPLARVVAEYGDKLPKFFKRYQIQPVWRADRPARGRFREFYQCDVDAIGSRSMIVEAELCAAACDTLIALGFTNFTIRLNHRKALEGILDEAGIPSTKHGDALTAIDKLDKIGIEGVMNEFLVRGIPQASGEALIEFFKDLERLFVERGNEEEWNNDVLTWMGRSISNHEVGRYGVNELRSIIRYTESNTAGKYIKINPSLARGLSYYTGAIMEINVPDLAGSLGGGGRYDNLVGMFSKQSIPACGFSLGLERIVVVMMERKMFRLPGVNTAADVMVTVWDESSVNISLELAHLLRSQGLRTDVYPVPGDKLGKQFKYASSCKVPLVVTIGPSEQAQGEVAVKLMGSGDQYNVPRTLLADELRKLRDFERIPYEFIDEDVRT